MIGKRTIAKTGFKKTEDGDVNTFRILKILLDRKSKRLTLLRVTKETRGHGT